MKVTLDAIQPILKPTPVIGKPKVRRGKFELPTYSKRESSQDIAHIQQMNAAANERKRAAAEQARQDAEVARLAAMSKQLDDRIPKGAKPTEQSLNRVKRKAK